MEIVRDHEQRVGLRIAVLISSLLVVRVNLHELPDLLIQQVVNQQGVLQAEALQAEVSVRVGIPVLQVVAEFLAENVMAALVFVVKRAEADRQGVRVADRNVMIALVPK